MNARSLKFATLAILLPLGGCMAWRSACLKPSEFVGRDARTSRKYEIAKVEYGANTQIGCERIERAVEDLFGSPEDIDRIMQYRPGVFAPRGMPVTVVVRSWSKVTSGQWTWVFPFALTATIVPAFITDEYFGEFEVRVDGVGLRRVSYRGVDSWHLSCIGPLGYIPCPQPDHPSACVWERNHGKVSLEPARQIIADAIAVALMDMEKAHK